MQSPKQRAPGVETETETSEIDGRYLLHVHVKHT